MIDRSALESAAALVHSVMTPTPQIAWPLLSARVGAEVWVKHENATPVGAFKIRGGLVYMDDLKRRAPDCPGVIAATRGNHGQSVATAAARNGLKAVIVVPEGNSREKNAAMAAQGAELVEHGHDFQAALAAVLQERNKLTNKKVGVVLSGGNIDLNLYRALLSEPESEEIGA